MHTNDFDKVKIVFGLTTNELEHALSGKDKSDKFALYMTAIDHEYNSIHIFKRHDFNMHTQFMDIRGYTTLYQLLCKSPYTMRDDKELFHFISNRVCASRTLLKDEHL